MKRLTASRLPVAATEKIVEAIRTRRCIAFTYHGRRRFVEPQSVGVSAAGHVVLRGYERGPEMLKLFDLQKMERLRQTEAFFSHARPGHNPRDGAMSPVIASLPPAD